MAAETPRLTGASIKPVFLVQAEINGKTADLDAAGFGKTWTIFTDKAMADHFAAELRVGRLLDDDE